MATIKTGSLDISLSYHETKWKEIFYTCDLSIYGESLFNQDFYGKNPSQKGFVFTFDTEEDYLVNFFGDVLKSRKGNNISNSESKSFSLKIQTWSDIKEEMMENWKGGTVMVGDNGKVTEKDYASVMNELFVPILENQVKIEFSFSRYLFPLINEKSKNQSNELPFSSSSITLSAETDFDYLNLFTEDLIKEQKEFLSRPKGKN